jgi:glycosyltransferase involved in cell wall biosynthesis
MRILFVVHAYVPESLGGVEIHCHHLASATAEGHDVAILARQADPARPDYALDERREGQVAVWRLNNRFTDLAAFRGIYRNDRIDELFEGLVARWRPDVVHVHHLIGLSVGILERTKRRGLPLVLGLHDYWLGCPRGQRIRDGLVLCHEIDRALCVPCLKPQNYEVRSPRPPIASWLARLRPPTRRRGLRLLREYDDDMHGVLALPDAFVTPARFHREMYARYGVDPRRMHILPYGLPTTSFAGIPRTPAAHFRIGFLGTLIPSKGAHLVLEAYRLLARPEATLDIHGNWVPFHGDDGYLDRLRAAAATIPGTIRFHGRYESGDVPRLLASLDVLVVPSLWYESYSIVIREGFLAGLPVVASGHGAMAEAIEHGRNGLLFRPGDATDLAAQLRRLIDEPELRQRIAAHPQQVVSIAENAARHLALYQSLLAAGSTHG